MKRRQILKQDAICTRRCGCIAAWPGSAGYLAEISEEDLSDGFLADIMNEKRSRIKSDSESSQSHADNVSEYFWWEPGSSSRNIQHLYGNLYTVSWVKFLDNHQCLPKALVLRPFSVSFLVCDVNWPPFHSDSSLMYGDVMLHAGHFLAHYRIRI